MKPARPFVPRIGGRVAVVLALALPMAPAWSVRPVTAETVHDARALRQAVRAAEPGTTIKLASGTYELGKLKLSRSGRPDAPITLTAAERGAVVLRTGSIEMLKITGAHWHVRGLDFVGGPGSHHAVHIQGPAHGTVIAGNRFRGFHAAIKSNGQKRDGPYPHRVEISRNVFANPGPRPTDAPVTPIDVVGGDDWRIVANFIADFAKGEGDRISYAAFLKGGGENGLIARNLVICEWRHSGGHRVGLSIGGGGFFFDDPRPEHHGATLVNNIVVNCPDQPAFYLNRAADVLTAFNTVYNAAGVDARFPQTGGMVADNLMTGAVLERDDASVTQAGNVTTGTRLGYYIPAARSKLTYRISDYHIKFPNWIDAGDVAWTQRVIRSVANWLQTTRLGLGLGGFRDIVHTLPDVWLRPGDATPLVNASSGQVRTATDFCGRSRMVPPDVGAIEYEAGPCDLRAELTRRYGPFLPAEPLAPLAD